MTKADPTPERLLGLLGLGRRAGHVVVGTEPVRNALREDRVACLVVAADASERTREKVVRLAVARGVPILAGPAAETLGDRLGRPGVMVAGVLDRALAQGLLEPGPGERPQGGVSG